VKKENRRDLQSARLQRCWDFQSRKKKIIHSERVGVDGENERGKKEGGGGIHVREERIGGTKTFSWLLFQSGQE